MTTTLDPAREQPQAASRWRHALGTWRHAPVWLLRGFSGREKRPALARVRIAGFVVLGLQLVGLMLWSDVLASRFALTWDFSIYHQAWWLIEHGNLNPYDTLNTIPFWSSHGELLLWPLALIGWVWPHAVTMLWLQDLATVAAEAVAFGWLCDLAGISRNGHPRHMSSILAGVGLLLLVLDPWVYWSDSFDFHFEMVGLLFVLLVARSLYRNAATRRLWLWVALALASGDVVATYLLGVGLGAILAGKRWRRAGTLVAGAAIAWTAVLTLIGANKGSGLVSGYGYLAVAAGVGVPLHVSLGQIAGGVLRHPLHVLSVLWDRRLNLYGAVAPAGIIGAFFPWVLPLALLVFAANALQRYKLFIVPGFQDAPFFLLVPVGTIGILSALTRRVGKIGVVAALLVAINVAAWGALWLSRTAGQWLTVSPASAAVLASIR